jgi:VWFA-related protein
MALASQQSYTPGVRTVLAVTLASITLAGAAARQPQAPTFKTGKTLRLVDVAVTDKSGHFVADLNPADFDLKADGRTVSVEAFYRIVGNRVRAPGRSGASASVDRSSAYAPVRTFVLFFDTAHMGLAALDRAKVAAQAFLQQELREIDYAGVITGGRLLRGRLLTARENVAGVIASIRPDPDALARNIAPPPAATTMPGAPLTLADEAEAEINAALANASQPVGDGGAGWEQERSLAYLLAVVKGMAALPGRQSVVFLSNGISIGGFMPGDKGGTGHVTLRMIVEAADTAGVRIYSIDPRGLDQGFASSRLISADAPRPLGESVHADELPGRSGNPRIAPEDVLSSLALDTGGLWIHNENNLSRAFDRVAHDNDSYYVLGYDNSNIKLEPKFTVRVRRPGMTVRARRGVSPR